MKLIITVRIDSTFATCNRMGLADNMLITVPATRDREGYYVEPGDWPGSESGISFMDDDDCLVRVVDCLGNIWIGEGAVRVDGNGNRVVPYRTTNLYEGKTVVIVHTVEDYYRGYIALEEGSGWFGTEECPSSYGVPCLSWFGQGERYNTAEDAIKGILAAESQETKTESKKWLAVWGDAFTDKVAGELGRFDSKREALERAVQFNADHGDNPAVVAWVALDVND